MKYPLSYLSGAHATAIAHVAIRSAALDHMIEFLLLELFMPNPRTAKHVIKRQATDRLVDLASEMLSDRAPGAEEQINDLIKRIKDARSERNKVLHLVWGETDDTGAAKLGSYRPFREGQEHSLTADQVGAIADQLHDCATDIMTIIHWSMKQRETSKQTLSQMLLRKSSPWPLI